MAGIYIHIPFCKQACTYCNFHFSTLVSQQETVLNAIEKEIGLHEDFIDTKEEIETIYFGGGTPSIIKAEKIETMVRKIREKFSVVNNVEITIEANPDDINSDTLHKWKNIGINRLSVGIQSFLEEELRWMNRAHTASESKKCLSDINATGFTNYSIDLIYGSPLLSNEQFETNVRTILDLGVPHVSCYALTAEPKTALHSNIRKKKMQEIDQEKQAEQFLLLMKWMSEAGYEHYEISNFCKPGMKSKHNSSYWRGNAYYGFGPSAHSFDGRKERRWNISNNALYLKSIEGGIIPFTSEILTPSQEINEKIMIALRTSEGLCLDQISDVNRKNQIFDQAKKYIDSGKLIIEAGCLKLTREGKLYADGIAADLFED